MPSPGYQVAVRLLVSSTEAPGLLTVSRRSFLLSAVLFYLAFHLNLALLGFLWRREPTLICCSYAPLSPQTLHHCETQGWQSLAGQATLSVSL